MQEFIISPADGNVIVKRELAISQVAKYMRFYPTASNSDVEFCMRVEVYGRDGKSVICYCKSRVFTRMNVYKKGQSHFTGKESNSECLRTLVCAIFLALVMLAIFISSSVYFFSMP